MHRQHAKGVAMREYMRQMLAGPGAMRFIVQPAIAIALGVWHGLRDAGTKHRSAGLRAIAVPLVIALTASVVFQYLVRARVRLIIAFLYAALFVAAPYFASRALTRLAARRSRPTTPEPRAT
jgi:hypothetical protein